MLDDIKGLKVDPVMNRTFRSPLDRRTEKWHDIKVAPLVHEFNTPEGQETILLLIYYLLKCTRVRAFSSLMQIDS